jgi:hypothetical protein
MPLDGLPLADGIRFQFDKAPSAWGVWEYDKGLRDSPQTSPALHADGERLQRPKQRQIAGRAAGRHAKGVPGRPTRQSFR